jgi:hypothetical protein
MGVLRKIRVDPNSWALKRIFIASFALSINLYMSCKLVLDLARYYFFDTSLTWLSKIHQCIAADNRLDRSA